MGRTLKEVLADLPEERQQKIEARAEELLRLAPEAGPHGDDTANEVDDYE